MTPARARWRHLAPPLARPRIRVIPVHLPAAPRIHALPPRLPVPVLAREPAWRLPEGIGTREITVALSQPEVCGEELLAPVLTLGISLRLEAGRIFGRRWREVPTKRSEGKERSRHAGTPAPPANPYASLYSQLYPPPDETIALELPDADRPLRQYQQEGIEFLVARDGALLADDMGLGKTAQAVVALAVLWKQERLGRALIICPRAVLHQWIQEARTWCRMELTEVRGSRDERAELWAGGGEVLITTPQLVHNDIELASRYRFGLVICDDVSLLKNDGAICRSIRSLPRERSWCLNGTPLENRREDLANTLEFVEPGLFTAEERRRAPEGEALMERVRPRMLRRRKLDVLELLPPKTDVPPARVELTGAQLAKYRALEANIWGDLDSDLRSRPAGRQKLHVFALISRLIRLCNFEEQSGESAKLTYLRENLPALLPEDEPELKLVLFSQSVETLEFLAGRLREWSPLLYTGKVRDAERRRVLEKFQGESRLLLLSTKAGGRGLNLQHAHQVVHFDHTWNPMDALQAEDRCWRSGQKQSVHVYSFLAVDTIEERIHRRLEEKRELFERYVDSQAVVSEERIADQWSLDELVELLRPGSGRGREVRRAVPAPRGRPRR